jgi:Flp pilus assembly protein TadG
MTNAKKLLYDQDGSILLEAAVAFPILIAILFGIAEFGEAFTIKRRNSLAASTASDLVSQVSCVTAASLQDVSQIGTTILQPYSSTLRCISVSSFSGNGTALWNWQQAGGAGCTAPPAPPSGLISQNQTVIAARATYTYTSPLTYFLRGPVTFTYWSYSYPRLSTSVALQASCPASPN